MFKGATRGVGTGTSDFVENRKNINLKKNIGVVPGPGNSIRGSACGTELNYIPVNAVFKEYAIKICTLISIYYIIFRVFFVRTIEKLAPGITNPFQVYTPQVSEVWLIANINDSDLRLLFKISIKYYF